MKNMTSYIKKAAFVGALAVMGFSCTPVDPLVYTGPELYHFPETSSDYFVSETGDSGFEVMLGVTTASSSARTFSIEVDAAASSAIEGVHYTLDGTTINIPANEVVGSVMLTGDFDQLGADGPQTLVFNLSDASGAAGFNTTYTVVLQQFCPLDQAAFVGTASVSSSLFGPWTGQVVEAGAESNQIILKDFYSAGNDIVVTLNDANPSNFTASITPTLGWVSGAYGDVNVDNSLTGSFSQCFRNLSLTLSHCVSIGCFPDDNVTITMD